MNFILCANKNVLKHILRKTRCSSRDTETAKSKADKDCPHFLQLKFDQFPMN